MTHKISILNFSFFFSATWYREIQANYWSNFNEISHAPEIVPSYLNALLKADLAHFKRLVFEFKRNTIKIGVKISQFLLFQCNDSFLSVFFSFFYISRY